MARFADLPLSAQTAYAQLFEATLAFELSRSVANLRGSFARKTVKGRDYWYFQFTDLGGTLRQLYVGPDSEPVRALVGESRRPRDEPVLWLARSAIALGCMSVLGRHFRVMRRLSEYGFFRAGGVLVGTHAFLSYGNLLGVRWGEGVAHPGCGPCARWKEPDSCAAPYAAGGYAQRARVAAARTVAHRRTGRQGGGDLPEPKRP